MKFLILFIYIGPHFEARRLKFCMYLLIIKKSMLSHLRPATVASEVTKGQGGLIEGIVFIIKIHSLKLGGWNFACSLLRSTLFTIIRLQTNYVGKSNDETHQFPIHLDFHQCSIGAQSFLIFLSHLGQSSPSQKSSTSLVSSKCSILLHFVMMIALVNMNRVLEALYLVLLSKAITSFFRLCY